MIRVLLADDEALIRLGFRRLLELDGEIEVVGEVADGEEAVRAVRRERPDVLLLDVRMPRKTGLEALDELNRSGGPPPTLILTTFDDAELLFAAVRRGARGFLKKDVSLEELLAAIRALAEGRTWLQPALTSSLRQGLQGIPTAFESAVPLEPLSRRELEVLRLMAAGHSNREIGDLLETAEGTVKNQVSSILGKMGVRDRTRAVLKAIEAKLI